MSTITRERVAQYANDPRMCNVNDEIRQIALIALASLEAEPVVQETAEREMLKRLAVILSGSDAPGEIRSLTVTAQSFVERCKVLAKERDSSRAAMLQSFGNSEQLNSPVIPVCSEDTKRLDWLDAQSKRLNEYHGTTYGWKFDANFQRNAMMLNDSNYPVMSVRQAIDEAIAAAPQQEVK